MHKSELIREIIKLQRRVNRAMRQYAPDAWMELNLTIPQLKSLFFIANQGETNFSRLATALGVTPSNVTGIIDRLVEQELVIRQENPQDRRMLMLRATDKGEALVSDLRERSIGHMSDLLARLNPAELAAVKQGLTLLIRVAEAKSGDETST